MSNPSYSRRHVLVNEEEEMELHNALTGVGRALTDARRTITVQRDRLFDYAVSNYRGSSWNDPTAIQGETLTSVVRPTLDSLEKTIAAGQTALAAATAVAPEAHLTASALTNTRRVLDSSQAQLVRARRDAEDLRSTLEQRIADVALVESTELRNSLAEANRRSNRLYRSLAERDEQLAAALGIIEGHWHAVAETGATRAAATADEREKAAVAIRRADELEARLAGVKAELALEGACGTPLPAGTDGEGDYDDEIAVEESWCTFM